MNMICISCQGFIQQDQEAVARPPTYVHWRVPTELRKQDLSKIIYLTLLLCRWLVANYMYLDID